MTYKWKDLRYSHVYVRASDLNPLRSLALIEHEIRFDLIETSTPTIDDVEGVPIVLE